MSRFISTTTKKIFLDQTEYVEVKEQLSYQQLMPILELSLNSGGDKMANLKMAMPLLEQAIVGWNLKNDKGELVIFDKIKIQELDAPTITTLIQECTKLYFPEKKSLPQ